ncbi:GNAT family N-acetyltransferase [Pseudomonas akapageensis]|uniref:GNAT family N-acetyltransferase n=1 Tax=Pseudomonas akapageensis TaxID=2609961 RepID=UPI00140C8002|nr:GNAT family N-acetyltransferase [Pseudomonas akapageensis]
MHTCLVPYASLNALQVEQLKELEVRPDQLYASGDIESALFMLLNRPAPGIRGFALLVDDRPLAFLLLKRPPFLPNWAADDAATLHAFQVDRRFQGQGLGKACLQALPAVARSAWPEITQLMLSVDPKNQAALKLYLSQGWVDCGEAYRAKFGFERKLVLEL